MHLVYRDAVGSTQSLSLEGLPELTLGRGPERHLVLDGRQVSRHHASIEQISGSYLLRDFGSANGTFLNGMRLSGTSAIALRDGDVVEIGSYRLCFTADVARTRERESRTPAPSEGAGFVEAIHHYADLLRDGVSWLQEHDGESDEASAEVLASFSGQSLSAGVIATLERLKSRLRVDVAAVFVKRRNRAPLELIAARPDDARGAALAKTFDLGRGEVPRLFYKGGKVDEDNAPFETLNNAPAHSAALVPFFRGANLLGLIAIERLRGPRIDRKHASIVAVYGDRISRALSIRQMSPNDTAYDFAGGAA